MYMHVDTPAGAHGVLCRGGPRADVHHYVYLVAVAVEDSYVV